MQAAFAPRWQRIGAFLESHIAAINTPELARQMLDFKVNAAELLFIQASLRVLHGGKRLSPASLAELLGAASKLGAVRAPYKGHQATHQASQKLIGN